MRNVDGEPLFPAGMVVPAGTYLEVEYNSLVTLDKPGPLPASLNGHRYYYSRLERPWIMAANSPDTIANPPN